MNHQKAFDNPIWNEQYCPMHYPGKHKILPMHIVGQLLFNIPYRRTLQLIVWWVAKEQDCYLHICIANISRS